MASLRNNISNHRAINIGDIFKDADAKPNIKEKDKLSTLIEEIVSNGNGINYRKDNFEFLQTKKFITNLILPEVKKYSYSDLPSIPETSQSTNFGNPTKISRKNRNILPKNIKYFFIDAAMNPKDYKNKDLTEEQVVETFASYMDPAGRSNPTETLYELPFEYIYLNEYGFKNGCYVRLLEGLKKGIIYIEICLNNLLLQCKIDRYGKIQDEDFVFTRDDGIAIPYYNTVKNIFFKGNPEKNKYINDKIDSPDNNEKNISIMLLLLKELGDTMQAIILEKILENAKKTDTKLGNYLGNSCLLTNDTVLATRCSMLSVPFLLKHNFILTSYQPPVSDADRRRILEAHDENQKLQEIERIILNNDSVIKTLEEFFNEIIKINKEIKNIKLSKQTGDPILIQNRPLILRFIVELKTKIKDANKKLNYILDIIKNDLKSVTLKLKGINPQKIYNKEDENKIIEICKGKFYIFRTYIYQLNAMKLFKKIENINEDTILTECYISTTKTSLFKTKIPIKLDGDTSNIDTRFSLINEDENEIFEQGFMNTLKNIIINSTSGGSSKKKFSNSYEEIYIKVYPYIYCYPWFIEFILDTKNNEIIKIFLQELIDKDEVVKTILNIIFSTSNEDEYYELSLYNNIHDDKKSYYLKLFSEHFTLLKKKNLTLLQKFRNYIMLLLKENTNTKSLSLPRKSNKATTLRKTKSLPNQRLTRKRNLERQTALPGKEKTPKRAKKITAKKARSSETPEQKTAKRVKKITAKKITAKRARSSEEQNIAPESPKKNKQKK